MSSSTVGGHVDTFVLNDITLTVPPTSIKITKDSVNYQWQTLRTNTSQKTKSGHSTITVEFTVPFVGYNEVHTKLKPLIAQLRFMPFCYAENQFLRQSIFPQELDVNSLSANQQTIVLALRAASISARNDLPGTVMATFQFAYFNYLPYTPYWQYKADLFGPDANKTVTYPNKSLAWQKFVAATVNKSTVAKSKTGEAQISFLELRTAPKSSTQTISQTKDILSSIVQNEKQFFDNFRTSVAETPDDAIKNAVRQTFPQFSNVDDIAAVDLIGPLLINAGPASNPLSKRYKANGQYIDQAQLKNTMSELGQRLTSREDMESDNPDGQDGFKLIESLIFQDNRGTGYGVFKRERALNLNKDTGIIIEGITVSIQNILATIPLIGHRYATFQHIGSIDASVYIDAKVTNDKAMSSLAWIYDTINQNMLDNRHIPQGLQTVRIDNEVLALMNLKEFITQDMETCTIDGSPGTYQVKLSFIESGLKQKDQLDVPPNDKFNLEFASSDSRVAKEIVRILNTNIKTINAPGLLSKSHVAFTSNITSDRNARFAAIVQKYISNGAPTGQFATSVAVANLPGANLNGGANANLFGLIFGTDNNTTEQPSVTSITAASSLNTFADQVSDMIFQTNIIAPGQSNNTRFAKSTIGNTQYFNILMSLNEDDVPGITKVQEIILAKLKQNNNLDKDIASQINKPLTDLQAETRAKVARGTQIDQIMREQATFESINFDPTDQTFTNVVTGASNAPPSTPLGDSFSKQLNNSAIQLLKTDPFVKWMEFISNFTVAIIESDDLDLPEFASAKALVKDLRLGRGLPAYPDFNLEDIVPDDQKDNVDALLSLDPDCYLSTPIDVSLNNFIDPALVANAKQIAKASFQSSLTNVNKFYNDSWLPSFISDSIRDKITSNLNATVSQQGTDGTVSASKSATIDMYYGKSVAVGSYTNSGANQSITLGTLDLDKNKIHASDSAATTLQVSAGINHSLNPMDLFDLPRTNDEQPAAQLEPLPNQKRGRAVTLTNAGPDGTINDNPTDLAAQAGTNLDTYALARLIASEDGNADQTTKTAIALAAMNYFKNVRKSSPSKVLLYSKYSGGMGKFGKQSQGRYAGTSQDPHEDDLRIAKMVASGQTADFTGGANHWMHPGSQSSAYYQKAIQADYLAQGRGTVKVSSAQEVLQKWQAHGWQKITVPGTNPDHVVFLREGSHNQQFAYTPPTPQTPSPDTGLAAGTNVADLAIQAFQASINNGQAMRMVRAFPTFKLYFIQDNSDNRRRYGLDDFYSYNSVVDITCVRSRKIPADLLEVTLTNVSGVLSNRKFQGARQEDKDTGVDTSDPPVDANGNAIARDPNGFLDRNSNGKKNTLASMMLQAGIDVELRLGTANDPDKLTTVFNGKIMEVEFSDSDDLIRIICQSHAIELVQDMKGLAEPIVKKGWFISDARTDILLERLLGEPEILHFGRWIRSSTFNSDTNTNRYLLTNKFELSPTPQDDNIFVPPIDKLRELDPGFLFSDIKYSIFQTTIWDIFDEMTLRHPGYIKSVVPYKGKEGPRMTMFFGLPSQLYFAADPSSTEKTAGSQLKQKITAYNNNVDQLRNTTGVLNPNMFDVGQSSNHSGVSQHLVLKPDQLQPVDFAAARLNLAKDFQSIKPFRAYHLVTSKNHIISNNIRASAKGTHNTISIQYGSSTYNKDTQKLMQEGTDVLTLSIDAALPDEEIRELFIQYANCQSKLMAKNYATALLMRELKDVYRGELTIIGNPDIKPYDIVQIFDDTSDIMGPIEVEQVIHKFSQDTGFITEITPDLFVTANEWVNMTANDMMSIIMEGAASALTHGTPTTAENVITSPLTKTAALGAFALGLGASPLIAIIGAGAAIGGYFMMQKMVDFTSHGQPVVIHPLIHRGKPWIAGLPIAKLNNLWSTNKGEWFKEAFDGLGLWWDDFNDKLVFAASQGDALNLFTGNSKPPQF